jgi:ComF family protein
LKNVLRGIVDIIFPPMCAVCGAFFDAGGGTFFCRSCFSKISFIRSPICPCCGFPYPGERDSDHLCAGCLSGKTWFKTARSVGKYDSTLLDAIHQFKYKGKMTAGVTLGKFMAGYDYPAFDIGNYQMVVPVPLHTKRLKERGFNQSLILAKEIARRFAIEIDFTVLTRKADTAPQVNLKRDQRRENVKGAFEIRKPETIKGKNILLVDDVYTTGSTVRECAKVMIKGGATEVAVLTATRAI